MKRIYNFNAGPAMLPLEVLQEVQSELLDLQGSGMSILEMSHRAPIYEKINAEAEADIKELLGLGDDYCVLFMGGGASLQFSMVPMNFLGAGQTAAYAVTSNFSDKAVKEAEKTDDCSCIIRRCNEKFRDFYRSVEFPYDKKEKKKLFLGQEYVPRKDTLPDYLSANEIRYGVNLYCNRCTNTPPLLTMANHRLRNNAETEETRKNGTRYS